jgi:hypothetical protein
MISKVPELENESYLSMKPVRLSANSANMPIPAGLSTYSGDKPPVIRMIATLIMSRFHMGLSTAAVK